MSALYPAAMVHKPADRAYVEAHRFMYGELGEHLATAAILFRERLMRPGFVAPVIRLAPVAPWGNKRGLSGNGCSLTHVEPHGLDNGIWLYLHQSFWDDARFRDEVEETVLHELLHNELKQFGELPKHKGKPWARRCQELSDRLGIAVCIEHARSIRPDRGEGQRKGEPRLGCPAGCLPYEKLTRWPHRLLSDGPPLRVRAAAQGPAVVSCYKLRTIGVAA